MSSTLMSVDWKSKERRSDDSLECRLTDEVPDTAAADVDAADVVDV